MHPTSTSPSPELESLLDYVRRVVFGLVPKDLHDRIEFDHTVGSKTRTSGVSTQVTTVHFHVGGPPSVLGRLIGDEGATVRATQLLVRNATRAICGDRVFAYFDVLS